MNRRRRAGISFGRDRWDAGKWEVSLGWFWFGVREREDGTESLEQRRKVRRLRRVGKDTKRRSLSNRAMGYRRGSG